MRSRIMLGKQWLCLIMVCWLAVEGRAQSWTRVKDIPALDVYALEVSNGTIYAGTSDRVYTGLNNGARWMASASLGDVAFVTSIKVFNGKLYAGTYKAGVFRSNDGGTTWEPVSNGIASINSISRLLIWNNELYAASYGEGVFKFDEARSQWNTFNNGLYPQVDGNIYDLAISNSTLVTAAGINGDFYRYNQALQSWDQLYYNSRGLQPGLKVNTIMGDGHSILAGIAGSRSAGLLRSDDNGNSWHADTAGMGAYFNFRVPLASLDAFTAGTTKNYAVVNTFGGTNGSNAAVLFARDKGAAAGAHWDTAGSFNNNNFVYAVGEAGGRLYAALDTGLYYKQIMPGGIIPTLPVSGILIYPNPTPGQAGIAFNSLTTQKVSVRVMDMSGRVLSVPYTNYPLLPGTQTLPIDLGRYPSAGYLIDIIIPGGRQTLRVVKQN